MEQNQVQNIPQELFVRVDNNTINSEKITAPRYSYWKSVGRSFFRNPVNYIVLGLVIFILIMSFIYPLFSPYSQAFWIKENYGLPKEDIAYLTPARLSIIMDLIFDGYLERDNLENLCLMLYGLGLNLH